ncbi:MAG: terminase small subunit [Chromatiales bacterium]|nr:terminase small subunit [Gammaproteobacteria bacterium]MCP5353185.1 terminase small subunit [Chromatiales bacterium]
MARKALSKLRQRFGDEYLLDLNAAGAWVRAGGSKNGAKQSAHNALSDPALQAYLQERMRQRSKRTEIKQDRVLKEIATLAFFDARSLFDEQGRLLPPHQWPDEVAAAVAGIDVSTKQVPGTDPVEIDHIVKIRLWDKGRQIELAGRHLKLFTDKTELTGANNGPVQVQEIRFVAPKSGDGN